MPKVVDESTSQSAIQLIQCFGIRWRRDLVGFRKPGRGPKGHVSGFSVRDKSKRAVNFWGQTGVYALYDGPELVYVGRAIKGNESLGARLAAHNRNPGISDRWTAFSWFGFRGVNNNGNLHAIRLPTRQIGAEQAAVLFEGLLIEFLSPRLNDRGGDLKRLQQYAQVRKDTLIK